MDRLHNAATNNDISTIIMTGAVYGIFLVFGESWSEFLRISILSMSPSHENDVLAAFIYALSASVFCLIVLMLVVKGNSWWKRKAVNFKKFRLRLRSRRKSNLINMKNVHSRKDLDPKHKIKEILKKDTP